MEATSWVLLALLDTRPEACRRAASWLKGCQLPDGSWPAMAGQPRGCWVTALASLALYAHGGALDQVGRRASMAQPGPGPLKEVSGGESAPGFFGAAALLSTTCHCGVGVGRREPRAEIRPDLLRSPGLPPHSRGAASPPGEAAPSARRTHALRPDVPGRRVEQRQPAHLRGRQACLASALRFGRCWPFKITGTALRIVRAWIGSGSLTLKFTALGLSHLHIYV